MVVKKSNQEIGNKTPQRRNDFTLEEFTLDAFAKSLYSPIGKFISWFKSEILFIDMPKQSLEKKYPVTHNEFRVNGCIMKVGDVFKERYKTGERAGQISDVIFIVTSLINKEFSLVGATNAFFKNSVATRFFHPDQIHFPLSTQDVESVRIARNNFKENKLVYVPSVTVAEGVKIDSTNPETPHQTCRALQKVSVKLPPIVPTILPNDAKSIYVNHDLKGVNSEFFYVDF